MALEIYVKHGFKPEIESYMQFCLNSPCRCDETLLDAGIVCIRCDEVWQNQGNDWKNVELKFKLRTASKRFSEILKIVD